MLVFTWRNDKLQYVLEEITLLPTVTAAVAAVNVCLQQH